MMYLTVMNSVDWLHSMIVEFLNAPLPDTE
jgi:hypothetical protein